ncbi:MAG: hypothetical protein ACREQY_07870 [Candidatus Binatia bacterium]
MRDRWRRLLLGASVALLVAVGGCVSEGPGSDFDGDGLKDGAEDLNESFALDPGETDFVNVDTDRDGLCDGLPSRPRVCDGAPEGEPVGCEDCDNDGLWEPCLGETDPLNDDTDDDGVPDGQDPSPLDGIDCSAGNPGFRYGDSLPPGKPFPGSTTPTPSPAPAPTPSA